MKYLMVFYLICIGSYHSSSQVSVDNTRDSLAEVRMERYERVKAQRAQYEAHYARDAHAAVDSVLEVEKMTLLQQGTKRLTWYENNVRIDTVKEINLTCSGLTEVPDFVFRALAMEVLLLDHNAIKRLPKELNDLPNLKRLYWRANNLERFFWIRIPAIEGLERFDISNNALRRLPIGVKNLEGLEELVIDENFFGAIPIKRLRKADFLEKVSLNKSHDLTLGAGRYVDLSFLETLTVNNSNIEEIHGDIYKMQGLSELQLQENQIVSLPNGISKLTSLKKLSFYKNQLNQLPDDFFDLDLEVVDLYYNELEVIPESIGNFKNLKVLFLAYNKVYELPESLGKLPNMVELYLHNNRLSVLPESLINLSDLKVARVNDNYLGEFPHQFLNKGRLEFLDIANNQIVTIPKEVENLQELELFTYAENPIDFEATENAFISPMIIRMIERGVVCVPRIYTEEIED